MTTWRSTRLSAEHELGAFDCEVAPLNDWLREQARRAQQSGTAQTYVWTAPESASVVAYYSTAPTEVLRDDIPRRFAGGVTRIPAYLLARLALDRSLKGQGLGTELLLDALEVIVTAAITGGGRLIVVDPIDENARDFYLHHDFAPTGHERLVMKVSTAQQVLASTAPE